MQYPAISQNFNYLFAYFSNNLQPLGTKLASFINDALSKHVGIKQPPFTPFTATLLVGGLTFTAVGVLFYSLFGGSIKPPVTQTKKNTAEEETSPVDEFFSKATLAIETANKILESEDLTSELIRRVSRKSSLSKKKITDQGQQIGLYALAIKDNVPLNAFGKLVNEDVHMHGSDFLSLLRTPGDLAKQKLEHILTYKKLDFIIESPPAFQFTLLMETPLEYIKKLPSFGIKVNTRNKEKDTILTKLASDAKRTGSDEHLPRIQALIKCGANPSVNNSQLIDAVDLGPEKGPIHDALVKAAKNFPSKK